MVLRKSAPVVAVVAASNAPASATTPAALMAFVRLPVSAVVALPALTSFGSPYPCLPPVLASGMSPHH